MAVFNSFTFDGQNSLDSGIYITGEAVFNAPERVVEMISVPGRNGALAIDQGRFENIEVTYPAGCFASNMADYADKVSQFRNILASRYTYKRLTDTYHPDEFRLGLYRSGLEVDSVRYNTAGEFDITFDCKPQRFLVDGDREISPTEWSDVQTESGELVTIESDGSLAVKSLEVSLSPIQAGSGEPSPDNVRPISGRTSVETIRTGVNVWDEEWEIGAITASGNYPSTTNIRSKNYIPCVGGATYFSKCSAQIVVFQYDENKTLIRPSADPYIFVNSNRTFTTLTNAHYMRFYTQSSYGTTYNNDISINYPSTDTDYHAYDGRTYTTSLGQTAYGGTLDVVSGVLTVDRAMVDLGSLNWAYDSAVPRFYSSGIASVAKGAPASNKKANIICSVYRTLVIDGSEDSIYGSEGNGGIALSTSANISVKDTSYTNATAFKTAVTGQTLVYELATPQTIQLTPQHIELLAGTNHLWSDGNITVTYGTYPLYNPTQFESKPLLVVTGKGVLQIGDYVLTIVGRENQTIYIDCESQEAWEVVGAGRISRNDYIQNAGEEFPVLVPGINNISVGSGITAVTITPRWWRI